MSRRPRLAPGSSDKRKCIPITVSELQSGKRVFDSAVALAEYWDDVRVAGPAARKHLSTSFPELFALLDANSAAVKGSTSDD